MPTYRIKRREETVYFASARTPKDALATFALSRGYDAEPKGSLSRAYLAVEGVGLFTTERYRSTEEQVKDAERRSSRSIDTVTASAWTREAERRRRLMHTFHPDIHEAGLADGCEACADAAERPMASLDTNALRDVLARAVDRSIPTRSGNEAIAVREALNALERVGKLAEVDPGVVGAYLRDRWRLDVQLLARRSA